MSRNLCVERQLGGSEQPSFARHCERSEAIQCFVFSDIYGLPRRFAPLHEPTLVSAARQQAERNASSLPFAASEGEGWGGVSTCDDFQQQPPPNLPLRCCAARGGASGVPWRTVCSAVVIRSHGSLWVCSSGHTGTGGSMTACSVLSRKSFGKNQLSSFQREL